MRPVFHTACYITN